MTLRRPVPLIAVTARICTLYGDFSARSDSGFLVFRIAGVSHVEWDECGTDRLRMWYDVRSSPERRTRPQFNPNVSAPRRTFTMDDETYDRLARGRHCGGQACASSWTGASSWAATCMSG